MITITPTSAAEAEIWRLVQEVTRMLSGLRWVLVGGMMVRVLEAEAGRPSLFATGDVDALMDVRDGAKVAATTAAAQRLVAEGFVPEDMGDDTLYRFSRGPAIVDVLAPDHLAARTSNTTLPPRLTLATIGGRQALNRSRDVEVDAGDGPFVLPLPTLAGALVMKARVATNTRARSSGPKQERDLARFLVLIPDPDALRAALSPREVGYLRAWRELLDPGHRAWRRLDGREVGIDALVAIVSNL
jgi:hypothetical protein